MAGYQSIFSGGQFSAPTKASPLAVGFTPGQFGKINAQIATSKPKPIDPTSIKDVPTLNKALKTGQINKNQWNAQFKTISGDNGAPAPYSVKNTFSALGGALNKVLLKPTVSAAKAVARPAVDIATGQGGKLVHDTAQLSRDTNGGAANYLLNASITNPIKQTAAQVSGNGIAGRQAEINSRENLGLGDKGTMVKHAAEKLAVFGGGSLLGAAAGPGVALKTGQKVVDAGKDLLTQSGSASKFAQTTKIGQALEDAAKANAKSDAIGKSAITGAKTTKIPVREATTTSIPVTEKSSTVVGKASSVPDKVYLQKSANLSKGYEADLSHIQKTTTNPATQQALQRELDAKYSGLQADLDKQAGTTSVKFNGKPQAQPKLPRSALTPTGETRPSSALQTAIENAHNAGDTATEARLVKQLPDQAMNPNATLNPADRQALLDKTRAQAAGKPTEPLVGESTNPTVKTAENASTQATSTAGDAKTSGSSLRTQQQAVEAGMKSEQDLGATYNTVSHKEEAAKAVQLVQDDPEKAKAIALGARGDNASHEAAVYHAVANQALEKAKKTGDFSEVQELANSPRHTAVSEAAQKLGAEGYNTNPHDPIAIMNDLTKTRQKALGKGVTTAKEATKVAESVKAETPKVSRQSWHEFVESLKC